jgi:hypothetical protein
MAVQAWRDWYHCMVGTYGQWLPGDERGWRERKHHEHVSGDYHHPPVPTNFSQARLEHSKRIMNWDPYLIEPHDREAIGRLLLGSFRFQDIPLLALAVCAKNFHALLQIHNHAPKRVLGKAKRHVTFEFAPIVDPATNRRQQLWEGDGLGKPIRDRAHAVTAFHYILDHAKEGAWIWCYRDDPEYARTLARAVADGGLRMNAESLCDTEVGA